MENSSPIWHSGKDVTDHAAYKLLKQALTPTTSKSTNSGQKPKQERAVLTAVVGDLTCSSKKILLMGSSKERMRRIRQNRAKIAELNASADEFTLEVQKGYGERLFAVPTGPRQQVKRRYGSIACTIHTEMV